MNFNIDYWFFPKFYQVITFKISLIIIILNYLCYNPINTGHFFIHIFHFNYAIHYQLFNFIICFVSIYKRNYSKCLCYLHLHLRFIIFIIYNYFYFYMYKFHYYFVNFHYLYNLDLYYFFSGFKCFFLNLIL